MLTPEVLATADENQRALISGVGGRDSRLLQGVEKVLGVRQVGTRFRVVAGATKEIIRRLFSFLIIPLQFAQKTCGIGNDLFVAIAAGCGKCHHIDAGDIILQPHPWILAGDMPGLWIDQPLDIANGPRHHGIGGGAFPPMDKARRDNSGDAWAFCRGPAPLGVLLPGQPGGGAGRHGVDPLVEIHIRPLPMHSLSQRAGGKGGQQQRQGANSLPDGPTHGDAPCGNCSGSAQF